MTPPFLDLTSEIRGVMFAKYLAQQAYICTKVLLPRARIGTVEIGLDDIAGNLTLITSRHRAAFKQWLIED